MGDETKPKKRRKLSEKRKAYHRERYYRLVAEDHEGEIAKRTKWIREHPEEHRRINTKAVIEHQAKDRFHLMYEADEQELRVEALRQACRRARQEARRRMSALDALRGVDK